MSTDQEELSQWHHSLTLAIRLAVLRRSSVPHSPSPTPWVTED